MKHELPTLEFEPKALEPFLSPETLEYHHGKHHRAYVDNLNRLLEGSEHSELELSELVRRTKGGLFNNAAQHFNHSFYWCCITPGGASAPSGALAEAIERDFGSAEQLERKFTDAAKGHFGSGWCWLVKGEDGKLSVETTSDAGCPVSRGAQPILTCDVWEHAYYIDYRNARPAYLEIFWKLVNWDFVGRAFEHEGSLDELILHPFSPAS